jgi:hypothetical protein
MRWFSWLLAVAVAATPMRAAFATTASQGAWKTAQLSVGRMCIRTASAGNVAIFAGGDDRVGDSGEIQNGMPWQCH